MIIAMSFVFVKTFLSKCCADSIFFTVTSDTKSVNHLKERSL